MREFHARPLPSFSPETLPVIQSKAPTCPEPFKISHGSIAYQQKLKHKVSNIFIYRDGPDIISEYSKFQSWPSTARQNLYSQ